jgi:hypothetical protein
MAGDPEALEQPVQLKASGACLVASNELARLAHPGNESPHRILVVKILSTSIECPGAGSQSK